MRWCAPEIDTFPKLIEKLRQRIEKLKEYRATERLLDTSTGDRLFKQQLDRQIGFFQALIEEYELTRLPGV
ncbi:MAG: hypothetical protein ACE5GO_10055 [Anaerolineales bacterium]